MDVNLFEQKLREILTEEQIFRKEPMSRHTTFRVGGIADFYVMPKVTQVSNVLSLCKSADMPCTVIGNGSNLLVGDGGIRGVVLALDKQASKVEVMDRRIRAESGALLSQVAAEAYRAGLSGFEFAAGIPGSIGGAVVMNAGAYGGELKDVLVSAKVLDANGTVKELTNEQLGLSYRHSCILNDHMVVLEALIKLQPKPKEEIKARMDELRERRVTKQPLEYPSAGSTFKRPKGHFAGKLIMDAGLAGFQTGGAKISEKHCGFVINAGGATAADIIELIQKVQKRVKEQFGVELEMEVRCIGEF